MLRRLDVIFFVAGLLVVTFLVGIATAKFRSFPYVYINQAWDALNDWRENWKSYLEIQSAFALPTDRQEGGVTLHDSERAWPGYTFSALYRDDSYGVSLIDMDGNTVHKWDVKPSEIWPDPTHIAVLPPDFDSDIHGSALLEDGDVILVVDGVGTVRLDRCSNVKWSIDRLTHHSVDILDNGQALISSRLQLTESISDYEWVRLGPAGFYIEDTVLRVDLATGEVLDEVSIIATLIESGRATNLLSGPGPGATVRVEDPTHLNDAEPLPAAYAKNFPLFDAGDVIVSLRNINTLAVLDGDDWHVKWVMTGPFLGQHDPDFLPNGNILVYDNRITGDDPRLGWTRIIEIDPVTREIVWQYQGTDEQPFYANSRGAQQELSNGNVLVTDPFGGRIFELARNGDGSSDIVWEYVNLVEPGFVGLVTDINRVGYGEVSWLDDVDCN